MTDLNHAYPGTMQYGYFFSDRKTDSIETFIRSTDKYLTFPQHLHRTRQETNIKKAVKHLFVLYRL